jgi:hypothetical protein
MFDWIDSRVDALSAMPALKTAQRVLLATEDETEPGPDTGKLRAAERQSGHTD